MSKYKTALQLAKRAGSRIPKLPSGRNLGESIRKHHEEIRGVGITDYIVHLTEGVRAHELVMPQLSLVRRFSSRISMYTFLRDKYNPGTVGEALEKLEQRVVPEIQVENWVGEGCFNQDMDTEYDAVCEGYPHLKERIDTIDNYFNEQDIRLFTRMLTGF